MRHDSDRRALHERPQPGGEAAGRVPVSGARGAHRATRRRRGAAAQARGLGDFFARPGDEVPLSPSARTGRPRTASSSDALHAGHERLQLRAQDPAGIGQGPLRRGRPRRAWPSLPWCWPSCSTAPRGTRPARSYPARDRRLRLAPRRPAGRGRLRDPPSSSARASRTALVIAGAHYDAVTAGEGADDNASGVGVMLEVAERLAHFTIDYDVVFIAFGAEDVGSRGSDAFVDQLRQARQGLRDGHDQHRLADLRGQALRRRRRSPPPRTVQRRDAAPHPPARAAHRLEPGRDPVS